MNFNKNKFKIIIGTLIVIFIGLLGQTISLASSHDAKVAELHQQTTKVTVASDKLDQKIQDQMPGNKLKSLTEASDQIMKLLFNYDSGKQYRNNQKKLNILLPDQAKTLLPSDDDSTGNSFIDGIGLHSKVSDIEVLSSDLITNQTDQVEVYITGKVHGSYKNYNAQSDSLGVKVLYKGTFDFAQNSFTSFERVGKLKLSAQSGS